jgi:hypothetical protein
MSDERTGTVSEESLVYLNRLGEALRFGLTRDAAHEFAGSDVDVSMLRRRLRGCDPVTAARILKPLD